MAKPPLSLRLYNSKHTGFFSFLVIQSLCINLNKKNPWLGRLLLVVVGVAQLITDPPGGYSTQIFAKRVGYKHWPNLIKIHFCLNRIQLVSVCYWLKEDLVFNCLVDANLQHKGAMVKAYSNIEALLVGLVYAGGVGED